ncbi:MAG: lamin tail domain-containing protein, partial [Ruminococcus sp.]|nr:lamin tail domain-containing protein [Ruminococcus sp.]
MLKRKTAAILTSLAAAASMLAPQAAVIYAATAEASGDINLDSEITAEDVQLIQDQVLGKASLTAEQGSNADINGDGAIDSLDLVGERTKLRNTVGLEAYEGLVINEVCTSNKSKLQDAAGAYPDWVEIYNSSDKDMVLDGVGLSDGAKKKFKFTFPEGTTIPAGGYIIVFCDDAVNQAEGEYHAAFKLSATGETVYLTHPMYGEIDSVAVPELNADTSYGRYANGSESFSY